MESINRRKMKVAKALLNQQNSQTRNRLVWLYVIILVALFIAHSYSSNLASGLKLIPQTMCAIGMGYVILLIISLRRFEDLSEFIDWAKVNKTAKSDVDYNETP